MSEIRNVQEEKTVSSEFIFDGKVVHLYCDKVALPDGKEATREYVKHIGAVCVVPITDEGEIVCVRQYRYAIGQAMLEIPAGKLDSPDEDRKKAALRELREETGATCQKLDFIGKFYSSPAILDECIYMYMARGLDFGETDFDEDEYIEIEKIPVDELVRMICAGEITDGKTQVAVLKAAILINAEKGRENNGKS